MYSLREHLMHMHRIINTIYYMYTLKIIYFSYLVVGENRSSLGKTTDLSLITDKLDLIFFAWQIHLDMGGIQPLHFRSDIHWLHRWYQIQIWSRTWRFPQFKQWCGQHFNQYQQNEQSSFQITVVNVNVHWC